MSVTNIAPRMRVASDPYFRGREHAQANHDILARACFVRNIVSCSLQTEMRQGEKLSEASTITEFTQPPTQ